MEASAIKEIMQRHPYDSVVIPASAGRASLTNPVLQERARKIQECAEKYRGTPIQSIPFRSFRRFDTDGDRSDFEYGEPGKDGYFVRRGRLNTFALMTWLFGGEDNIRELENIIWAICDEYSWCLPAHMGGKSLTRLESDGYTIDLFAAETGHALSEILMLVGDRLTPIVKERAERAIRERILNRMVGCHYWWKKGTNNWAAVCGGSVGMAAIYQERDPDRLAAILEEVDTAMRCFLSGFPDDGACLEGIGYWSYGFGYFTSYAELLCRRTGGEIDYFDDPKVRKVASFWQKCVFPGGRSVSFSDGSSRASADLGLMSYLSRRYPEVVLPKDVSYSGYSVQGCNRWTYELRDFLWTDGADCGRGGQSIYLLPDAQWYIATSENKVSLAAKAGHNDEPHNHNDIGNFQLYKNGVDLLCDIGSGNYSKQYFSSQRYELYLCCASRGHSVPLIAGAEQKAGKQYAARDVQMDNGGMRMDIAPAYGHPDLKELIREIRFDTVTGKVVLTDSYQLERPVAVTERFVTFCKPEITKDGVRLASGNEQVLLRECSGTYQPHIVENAEEDHGGKSRCIYFVDFELPADKTAFKVMFEVC